jgi:hypothetical protein
MSDIKDIKQKKTCTSFTNIVLRVSSAAHSTFTSTWIVLAGGSRKDLHSVHITHHVKQVQ